MQLSLPIEPSPREHPELRRGARRHVVAGLFAGVGGIERGLTRAGHETALLCELDPAAAAVLEEHFPDIARHDDVRTLRSLPSDLTLLAAGFPCQDLSQAGMTAGIDGARSGLVMEVFRLLRRRRVPWVLLENVPFMLHLGKGRALEVVVSELERLGYRWAYRVVDARAFGLPQRRERVYVVAALDEDPRAVLFADEIGPPPEDEGDQPRNGDSAFGFYWTEGLRGLGWAADAVPTLKGGSSVGIPSPPAIWLPSGSIVTPSIRDAERLQGFPKDWTKPAELVARPGVRWKLVGNAVCVPVAAWIGQRLARPGDAHELPSRGLPIGSPWPRAAWNVGKGRRTAPFSAWPKRSRPRPLLEFLGEPTVPLSYKATAGFYTRARQSSLRFAPGFLAAVRAHMERMGRAAR